MKFHFNLKIAAGNKMYKRFFSWRTPIPSFQNGIFSDLLDAHTEKRRDKRLLKHGFLLELDIPTVQKASSVIPDGTDASCSVAVDALASVITDHKSFCPFFLGSF